MVAEVFAGDKKVGQSVLHSVEKRFVNWMVPKVPKCIETYHLTLMTIPISILIVLLGFAAAYLDIRYLYGVSFLILAQWFTDSLDGAVGRARNTGLIKWGYYMDHFLDYIFLSAVLISYLVVIPRGDYEFSKFLVFALIVGFMVNSYLAFATTNKFKIVHLGIGPTEVRLGFIVINVLIVLFGKTYLAGMLPYLLGCTVFALTYVVYNTQKEIWKIDMDLKALQEKK